MTTSEWIAYVDARRGRGGLLATGEWHGYTDAPGGTPPMRGRYYLVRWAAPTVAVSHDDPEEAVTLAMVLERGLERYVPPVPLGGLDKSRRVV